MARPLRLEFAGALYHVTSRGDGREDIVRDVGDRQMFFDVLAGVWERFNWVIHADCLMTNHCHLLVETPDGNLARGMRELNGVYTQRFNRVHQRVGHVFQGRYKAILIQKEAYLLEVARYVVLNPVRARMVRSPEDYPWSSYRAMIGEDAAPEWLETRAILSAFGRTEADAVAGYRSFVAAGKGQRSPWESVKQQVFLGSEAFVEAMQRKIPQDRDLREVPQAKRRPVPRALPDYERAHADRNEAIKAAYAGGGYTMQEIGDYFGLHGSRISKIIRAAPELTDVAQAGT
ncbi:MULTISPECIES: transposase [unclassified Thiocapsa]|uniref:REP-associated tyrosine transposase n=1 Tax=unclassified Thiocapsa TaxID=2641286 RepID=UPI0035B0DFD3